MRRVLLLTYAFPPDNVPGAARPGQIYGYLPQHGFQPVVFASSHYNAFSEHALVHRLPAGGESSGVSHATTLIRWFTKYCAPYDDRLSWAPCAAAAAAQFVRNHSVSAIYSTSPFLAAHLVALWLKARFGLPWIADFQDPIRDNPFRRRRWIYPYDTILERAIFRKADRLIANTDTVAAAWCGHYPQWTGKISVLWNSFDPHEEIEPSTTPSRTYRILAHVGSLYGGRHPGHLLAAVKRLGIDRSALRVKLVGPLEAGVIERHATLFEELCQSGVLEFENRLVPRREAMKEIGDADFLLLLDLNETNASLQVPSKLLDYIRAGKPILAYTPTNSPVQRILVNSEIPYVALDPAAPGPDDDQNVLAFLRAPRQVHHPSRWFEENFSAATQARTLARLLEDILQERRK